MGSINDKGRSAFRDFNTDGVPASGAHEPAKPEIRDAWEATDAALTAIATVIATGKAYATKALMDADLTPAAGTLAAVYNDSDDALNGFYVKSGGTGTGSWLTTNIGFPASFAGDLSALIAEVALKAYTSDLTAPTGASIVRYLRSSTAVARTVESRLRDTASAKDFGAIGDGANHPLSGVTSLGGVNTTGWTLTQWQTVYPHATALSNELDWCAIQAGLNWLRDNGGGTLELPPGSYTTNRSLTITTANLGMRGHWRATAIKATGNFDTISVIGTQSVNLYANNIENIYFDESGKTGGRWIYALWYSESVMRGLTGDNLYDGIVVDQFNNILLDRIVTQGFRAHGSARIKLLGGVSSSPAHTSDVAVLRDVGMGGSAPTASTPTVTDMHGIIIDGWVNTVTIQKSYAVCIEGYGYWLRNSIGAPLGPGYTTLQGIEADFCAATAVYLQAGGNCHIIDPQLEDCWASAGIVIGSAFTQVDIKGGQVNDNGWQGIAIDGTRVSVTGTHIYSNSISANSRGGTPGSRPGVQLQPNSRAVTLSGLVLGTPGQTSQSNGIWIESGADNFNVSTCLGEGMNLNGCVKNDAGVGPTKVVDVNTSLASGDCYSYDKATHTFTWTFGGRTLTMSPTDTVYSSGNLTAPFIKADGAAYFTVSSGAVLLSYDANDYTSYTRSSNTLQDVIAGTTRSTLTSSGLTIDGNVIASGGCQFNGATIAGVLQPSADNSVPLGTGSLRWSVVYAGTGTINTSDEREKTWRGALTVDELAAARDIAQTIGIFQFNDAIALKGPDGARLHTGVKAQQTISIMESHGLDPMRYGFVCYDQWDATEGVDEVEAVPGQPEILDEDGNVTQQAVAPIAWSPAIPARAAGDRYGIRPDELAMFLTAAQEQRIAALEAA